MDEDVPMDQDQEPKPQGSKPNGEDLSQYNLDEYDNDEAMPGMFSHSLSDSYSSWLLRPEACVLMC